MEIPNRSRPGQGMPELSVLSIGYTRGLWEGEGDEERRRLVGYSQALRKYIILVNAYRRHGLRPLRIGTSLEAIPTNAFTPFDSFLRMLWLGARAIRRDRISVIQAQDPILTGCAAMLLGRAFRLPVNVCVYGPNVFDPHWQRARLLNRLAAPLGRLVLRHAAGVQVDGRMTAECLVREGVAADRVRVKPMVPTNIRRFLTLDRPQPSASARTHLLFVGRLEHQKNLPMLVEVLTYVLHGRDSDPELLVVGDGPDRGKFLALLQDRGVSSCVRWLGQLAREQLLEVFRDAHIFVLTSHYEGFPRVLMEAAASGLPIVTTAVSGSDEAVLDGRTGFVVPVGDAVAFGERLRRLNDDPALRDRMGRAAREHILRLLDSLPGDARQISIWTECLAASRRVQDP